MEIFSINFQTSSNFKNSSSTNLKTIKIFQSCFSTQIWKSNNFRNNYFFAYLEKLAHFILNFSFLIFFFFSKCTQKRYFFLSFFLLKTKFCSRGHKMLWENLKNFLNSLIAISFSFVLLFFRFSFQTFLQKENILCRFLLFFKNQKN